MSQKIAVVTLIVPSPTIKDFEEIRTFESTGRISCKVDHGALIVKIDETADGEPAIGHLFAPGQWLRCKARVIDRD